MPASPPREAAPTGVVTFLSDYGLDDTYVGVCHGVLARLAPDVRVIDVCHQVAPHDVRHGASLLADAVAYLPVGVHLATVDPVSAGGASRGVAVLTADGSTFVAPDNGLTSLGWDVLGGVTAAWELAEGSLWHPRPSPVFRGRDVFAPVAARLAAGLPAAAVGPQLDPAELVRLAARPCRLHGDHVHAEVSAVDHGGNLALNASRTDLEAAGMVLGDVVEVRLAGRTLRAPFALTPAGAAPGRVAVCEDSHRRIMLAVNLGRAASTLRASRGDALVIGRVTAGAPL